MKAIDLNLYNALMKKINLKGINPEFCTCDWCNPKCQTYYVKMFGKKFTLEISFSSMFGGEPIASITSNSIRGCEISLYLHEIDFYNKNKDLLK